MKRRPLIGVTGSRDRGGLLWWLSALSLRRAGARVLRIQPGDKVDARRLDALMVGGGDDIVPTLYGGEIDPKIRLDPDRDQMELELLVGAEQAGLPVLGVCRGAQMMNVFRGGTLYADIWETLPHARKVRTVLPRKTIQILPETDLRQAVGYGRCRVNALHHQSVQALGRDLRICARDEFGIVQAVEDTAHRFYIGVQWHPEFLLAQRSQQGLFRRLVQAAKAHHGL